MRDVKKIPRPSIICDDNKPNPIYESQQSTEDDKKPSPIYESQQSSQDEIQTSPIYEAKNPEYEAKTPEYEVKTSEYEVKSSEYEVKVNQMYKTNGGDNLSRSDSEKTTDSDHLYEVINPGDRSNPPSPSSDGSSSGQRSLSYQYAGSETESDIYYPYVFYANEEGSEEDGWKGGTRVRVRRSRNVVHKTLEDNYGAVVIANHEALAQVLEQMNHNFVLSPPHLKSLKTSPPSHFRLRDFTLNEDSKLSLAGRNYFAAQYGGSSFIVCLSEGGSSLSHTKSLPPCFVLSPVVEFSELVPGKLVSATERSDSAIQASIAILPCQHTWSLPLFAHSPPPSPEDKDAGILLIQLLHAVKCLQACGVDSTLASMEEFLLCGDDKTSVPRLCVLPVATDKLTPRLTLCQCVSKAVSLLLPLSPLSPLLQSILSVEKLSSLSQAKSVLELWVWGPEDLRLNEDKQVALQRWLDLDRATCLHSLVCSRPPRLSSQDYAHLLFLVRTNAKCLADAARVLHDYRSTKHTIVLE
uniref:Uncharacterized protein n=1 Tax=Cacopsylla melanoneura TaxID=428564 RepID=A0A8D8UVT9_9HEMI